MKKYESVQRYENHYVDKDCLQTMIPHHLKQITTILNANGMIYHYKPNSPLFINEYTQDKRREAFPYSEIPNHKDRIGLIKYEYVNQLIDFNKVYIEITNGIINEFYAIKDGDQALLATKYIIPNEEKPIYVNRDELVKYLEAAKDFTFDNEGGKCDLKVLTEERILQWYKERIAKLRENELCATSVGLNNELTEYINKSIEKLTIADVMTDITLLEDIILVNVEASEIKSVKSIKVKFMGPDKYKIESYDYPITIYTLEHMKRLEQTNLVKTREPKFPKRLNKNISSDEIEKSRQLIIKRKNSKKD